MTTAPDSVPLRCSTYARVVGLDPIGTAGSYDCFVLVEHPLPWPADVAELPALAAARDAAVQAAPGARVRMQALVPEDHPQGTRRVIVYRRPSEDSAAYDGRELVAGTSEVADAVSALLAGGGAPAGRRDVLVCTHGRRDVCCGSRGAELFAAAATLSSDPAVRWWRTSHTGGHRFAPTAIVLPEGQLWAYLDPDVLRSVLGRTGPVPGGHFRGSAALPSPAVQAVEREAFLDHGWDWLTYRKTGWEEPRDGPGVTAVVDYETPTGGRGSYRGTVTVTRLVPVLDCGKPVEQAKKSEPELLVSSLTHQPG